MAPSAKKFGNETRLKLLLIGDSSVGKSSLLLRFAEDSFSTTFISTIGVDFKTRTVELDGEQVKLSIWDTAGQERFRTITAAYYRGANGIILVYDITSQTSFDNIRSWIRNIEEHAADNVCKLLVGNKCDMRDKRAVPTAQGEKLAKEYNIPFFETSARESLNVEDAFQTIARESKKRYDTLHAKDASTSGKGPLALDPQNQAPAKPASSCCG
eukprot:TRINITY_DN35934_c0_g1_i1.p2 TRINITY_DN35934_c0_g1~~TRINITY_DN35934_c0_g1_i1.p2  ORF type:complete len:213 (-),score=43.51 TRINITY_DN35934_c0_g1_i1:1840-2478(-)